MKEWLSITRSANGTVVARCSLVDGQAAARWSVRGDSSKRGMRESMRQARAKAREALEVAKEFNDG